MTDPKTRALSLLDELVDLYGVPNTPTEAALRLAITQIPTTSWQPIQTAPIGETIRVLYDLGPNSGREVIDARLETKGRWWSASGEHIDEPERLLAWRPADSTELPGDWGTK